MEIVKDAADQVLKRIPAKYRTPIVLVVIGALVSTWALAKFDERVKDLITPMKKQHDSEITGIENQLKSIDRKLDIVLEKL